MSFSPAMIKAIRHIALLIGFCLASGVAQAQFVKFRLEIPAGVSYPSQVVDPMSGGTWENNKAMVWMELQAQENLSFLLELDFPEGDIQPPLEAFYLNDGTANFEVSKRLKEGVQELQMIHPLKLIRNADPRPPYYQAWLGLPIIRNLTVKIEYP
jgi:hypothetical protein